jgi:glycosyltransferase involved in cell wall biosynthesis
VRVLHLGKYYAPARGGMETILELVCVGTSSRVQNRVLVANDRFRLSEEQRGSVEVIRVPAVTRIGAVSVCPTMPFRLARERADLIVIHEPNPMGLLTYFLARPPTDMIIWFHSEVIRPSWRYRAFYRPFLQFALRRAAFIVVSSPTLAASAAALQEWQSKCVVIPYGIQPDREPVDDQVLRRADLIRRQHNRPIVLFVGRLVRYKGADVLLDAMRGIEGVALLAGGGPERAGLERRAESLGVSDRVRFLGEVTSDELAALYRACDLLVLPSVTRQEAFGVVLLEAMAAAKPVISTDLGTGSGWVNQHGETGLVVPPGNAAALHDAIHQLISQPEMRVSFGAAARRRVRSAFTIDRMIDATLDLYRAVAASGAGSGPSRLNNVA